MDWINVDDGLFNIDTEYSIEKAIEDTEPRDDDGSREQMEDDEEICDATSMTLPDVEAERVLLSAAHYFEVHSSDFNDAAICRLLAAKINDIRIARKRNGRQTLIEHHFPAATTTSMMVATTDSLSLITSRDDTMESGANGINDMIAAITITEL